MSMVYYKMLFLAALSGVNYFLGLHHLAVFPMLAAILLGQIHLMRKFEE